MSSTRANPRHPNWLSPYLSDEQQNEYVLNLSPFVDGNANLFPGVWGSNQSNNSRGQPVGLNCKSVSG